MRNTLARAVVAATFAVATAAGAQPVPAAEIAALRAEIAALTARLDRLEQVAAPRGAQSAGAPAAGPATAVTVVEPRPAATEEPSLRFWGDRR